MSVKKNILTISCFILLFPGSLKAMDPEQKSQDSSFTNVKKPMSPKSGLRLSGNRLEKKLSHEDTLKRDLKEARDKVQLGEVKVAQTKLEKNRKGYVEAKEELVQNRKIKNGLKEELEKLKGEALITIETKSN